MHVTRARESLITPRNLPLLMCYVLFPISNATAELIGVPLWRNWIDLAWVGIAAVALMRGAARVPIGVPAPRFGRGFLLCGLALTWLALGTTSGRAPTVTAAMEAKPALYLAIALLIALAFRLPSPRSFCRFGAALAVLLLFEVVLRSAIGGTMVRPLGSGEVNYDAALLCLSLVFALSRRELARSFAPIIFLGLLASFSRTSLLAACGALLFAGTVPAWIRLLMVSAAAGAGVMSFAIRDLEVGTLESMDRYWMWAVGIEYILSNAWSHAVGAVPGAPIDVEVPRFLADLWLEQQENVDVDGIFPFHFHAMWLRLATSWGWIVAASIALWLAFHAFVSRYRSPQSKIFFLVCLVLGLTMGLLYLSNVAIPFLLALIRLLHDARYRRMVTRRVRRRAHPLSPPVKARPAPVAP